MMLTIDHDHDTFLLNGELYTCGISKLSGKHDQDHDVDHYHDHDHDRDHNHDQGTPCDLLGTSCNTLRIPWNIF